MTAPAATYAGPPADRMAGRPSRAKAQMQAPTQARAQTRPDISARLRQTTGAAGHAGREHLLDRAVHCGVITSGLRGHYAAAFDADPTATRAYLASIGLRAEAEAPAAAPAPEDYDEAGLSRTERQRVAAAREGRQHTRIVSEV